MSDIAKGAHSFALDESKPATLRSKASGTAKAVSEHDRKHKEKYPKYLNTIRFIEEVNAKKSGDFISNSYSLD